MKFPPPLPIFDALQHMVNKSVVAPKNYPRSEIEHALSFLISYQGSQGTFNAYRREIERLLHWTILIAAKKLKTLKKEDIEAFITFCQKPPKTWIGMEKPARFIVKNGMRIPNAAWRPFVVTVSKSAHLQGETPLIKNFELSQGAVREIFAILSSFFQYLVQLEYITVNPVALIRQKSQFLQRTQNTMKIRRLSELQWQYVIHTAKELADAEPLVHERTLFIMSILYGMYLRISELAASPRWTPEMSDFFRDNDNNWWFNTVGKGNKARQIAVSTAMLDALKRWRKYLGLTALPSPADNSPLIPKTKGKGAISSTNAIRKIVQFCFDTTREQLIHDGFTEEASQLNEATVHWLRHTGISEDVKIRPREHVRDDAGHSSSAITDKYIDIELRERHRSARKKTISED